MRPFVEKVQVDIANRGKEPVGIISLPSLTVREVEAKSVPKRDFDIRNEHGKEAAGPQWRHRRRTVCIEEAFDSHGVGMKGAHHDTGTPAYTRGVCSQTAMRFVMLTGQKPFKI